MARMKLDGNKITANGSYEISTLPGTRYLFSVAGSFDGASIAIRWLDSAGNATAFEESPLTAAGLFQLVAPSSEIRLVVTGIADEADITVAMPITVGSPNSGGEISTANVLTALQGNQADPTRIGAEYLPEVLSLDSVLLADHKNVASDDVGSLIRNGNSLAYADGTEGGAIIYDESRKIGVTSILPATLAADSRTVIASFRVPMRFAVAGTTFIAAGSIRIFCNGDPFPAGSYLGFTTLVGVPIAFNFVGGICGIALDSAEIVRIPNFATDLKLYELTPGNLYFASGAGGVNITQETSAVTGAITAGSSATFEDLTSENGTGTTAALEEFDAYLVLDIPTVAELDRPASIVVAYDITFRGT